MLDYPFKFTLTRNFPFVICDESGPRDDEEEDEWPIVYSSPGWNQMMGYTAEEVLKRDPRLLKCCWPDRNGALSPRASIVDRNKIEHNIELAEAHNSKIVQYNTRHSMNWRRKLRERRQIHGYQINFQKDGTMFNNELILIPVIWNRGDREGLDQVNLHETDDISAGGPLVDDDLAANPPRSRSPKG